MHSTCVVVSEGGGVAQDPVDKLSHQFLSHHHVHLRPGGGAHCHGAGQGVGLRAHLEGMIEDFAPQTASLVLGTLGGESCQWRGTREGQGTDRREGEEEGRGRGLGQERSLGRKPTSFGAKYFHELEANKEYSTHHVVPTTNTTHTHTPNQEHLQSTPT